MRNHLGIHSGLNESPRRVKCRPDANGNKETGMTLRQLFGGAIGFVAAMLVADFLFGILPTPEETLALAVSVGIGLLVQNVV